MEMINITKLAKKTGIAYSRLYKVFKYKHLQHLTLKEREKVASAVSKASIEVQEFLFN
jgi:predicted transcriptional regulator